jgi:hypothetical protein
MADVTIDILTDATWKESDGRVREIVRTLVVHGLTPDTDDGLFQTALNDAGVPQPGAGHPTIAGLICKARETSALATDIVKVKLTYRLIEVGSTPVPGLSYAIRGGTSLEQVETNLDGSGTKIEVEHNEITQGGLIRPFVARRTHEVTGRITGSSGNYETLEDMDDFVATYSGLGNLGGFPADTTAADKTWICAGVDYRLADVTETGYPVWEVSARFSRSTRASINPDVIFIDPNTGQPPPDLVANTGYKTVDYYATVDFDGFFTALD